MSAAFQNPVIVGAGSWGSALAALISQNTSRVYLLGREEKIASEINATHRSSRYLPNLDLPKNIIASTDFALCEKADLLLFVVPTSATRSVAHDLAKLNISPETILLSCAKGIERETGKRMSQIISEFFPENRIAALSGPNHAEEIARGLPAASAIGSASPETLARLQRLFTTPRFRAYTSEDLAGIELGGAIKNVFAIAAGVAKGLQLGDNAISALVTRGLAEMIRLGTAMGGQPETFTGLSGLGDLITTCFSEHSRNHRVGLLLGEGKTLEQAVANLGMVAEGVPNTRSIYEAARRFEIRSPLIDAVYRLLYENEPARDALNSLFDRSPRHELE